MGSDAVVVVVGGAPGLADAAMERLGDLERRWSRFLPDSEVSRANRCAGTWTRVGPETRALFERAELATRRTGGRFDATRLHDVVAAGYDRSFEQLGRPSGRRPAPCWPAAGPEHRRVLVDHTSGSVLVPEGAGFDPGGIGKGFAADLVVAELLGEGAGGACVSVGGDVRVAGHGPDATAWRIDVDDPRRSGAEPLMTVTLADGAVATSSRCRRRWRRADGSEAHHLIDPGTGAPAETATLAATVVAAEGWQAEALAKVAFVASDSAFLDHLTRAEATGLVVTEEGVTRAPGLGRFVVPRRHRAP
jgi:thiamine biosynthesis lipoprotein